jgi:CheY-like chemotaxis protein
VPSQAAGAACENDAVATLRPLLREDIEISLDLAEDVWPVMADPVQIESSLANLATNARDAMPNGGSLMIATANRRLDADYVAMHPDVAGGDYVMIEVSDTGSGIAPETLERIFEPFFTTKEHGKGTGLGLSMVFGFLRQVGIGTTFRLYFPHAGDQTSAVEDQPALEFESGAGETILVVEDNPEVRRTVLRQLDDLGYRAFESANAAEALDILDHERVDLLLTDVVMPGGNGVDLARAATERCPGLKILLTSGFPQLRIDDAGNTRLRLLGKPFSCGDLAVTLRACLNA